MKMSVVIKNLENALRDLEQKCDLIGSALVTARGQMMSSSLPQSTEEKAVSAMAASILSIGHRVGRELDAGAPKSILIDGTDMSVIIRGHENLILVGIAPVNCELALVDFELGQALDRIRKILEREI